MLCSDTQTRTDHGTDCQGYLVLSTIHITVLGGLVDHLIKTHADEIIKHEIGYGSEAGRYRTNGCTDIQLLCRSRWHQHLETGKVTEDRIQHL